MCARREVVAVGCVIPPDAYSKDRWFVLSRFVFLAPRNSPNRHSSLATPRIATRPSPPSSSFDVTNKGDPAVERVRKSRVGRRCQIVRALTHSRSLVVIVPKKPDSEKIPCQESSHPAHGSHTQKLPDVLLCFPS